MGVKSCFLSYCEGKFRAFYRILQRFFFHFIAFYKYYYKPNPKAKEVDIVVCDKSKAIELIQVAYDIDAPKTYERETSSLVRASEALHCNQLTLVAMTQRRDLVKGGKTIHIVSAIEWLMRS